MTEIRYAEEKKQIIEGKSKRWSKVLFYLFIIGFILFFLQWKYSLFFNSDKACLTTPGDKLILESHGEVKMHIHPTLSIKALGENVEIPAGVGISNNGMNAIHTHTADGVLHVEAPCIRDLKLGDFFAIWGKKFDKEHILNYTVNSTNSLKMFVNNIESKEFENLILGDKDKIEIVYG